MSLKAIIVDDEFRARALLKKLLKLYCPTVQILAESEDVELAVAAIKKYKPDIVFLDVEMPRYSGYEIVKFFDIIDFNIVFVTAYDQYALKAFEIAAIDYLLKPIEIERLKMAVKKVQRNIETKSYMDRLLSLSGDMKKLKESYPYSHKGYTHYVKFENIVAFEAQGAYTIIHFIDGKNVLISKNIKVIEKDIIDTIDLKRIHRSWIINRHHIVKYAKSNQKVILGSNIIARVSRLYKESAESFFEL